MTEVTREFTGHRVIFTSHSSFENVVENVRRLTHPEGRVESIGLKPPKPYAQMTKDEFITFWKSRTGSSGFSYFTEFDYGGWIGFFGVGEGLRLKRFIVGNPLIAITMIEHDRDASLFAPVEFLVKELEEGKGTEVSYNKPSSQMAAGASGGNEKLRDAARKLDLMLEELIRDISA